MNREICVLVRTNIKAAHSRSALCICSSPATPLPPPSEENVNTWPSHIFQWFHRAKNSAQPNRPISCRHPLVILLFQFLPLREDL